MLWTSCDADEGCGTCDVQHWIALTYVDDERVVCGEILKSGTKRMPWKASANGVDLGFCCTRKEAFAWVEEVMAQSKEAA